MAYNLQYDTSCLHCTNLPPREEVANRDKIKKMSRKIEKPNCLKCRHYQSTYDPQAPRGCSAFNFKSVQFPSWLVKKETGKECQVYELAAHLKGKVKELDLNDDELW